MSPVMRGGMAQVAHIGASGCQGDDAALACARGQQLALARVRNVRDLGGYTYRAEDGSQGETAFGVFLRGPSLRRLGSRDFEVLRGYGQGLKCVVDLRSDFEARHWPDPYANGRDGVTYVHIPMLDRLHAKGIRDAIPDRMSTVYKSLLDNDAQSIHGVMEAIDRYGSGGCTLFHCRVGKDRTGVIAMLLLGLAGVSDADILEDFAATQRYIGRGTGGCSAWPYRLRLYAVLPALSSRPFPSRWSRRWITCMKGMGRHACIWKTAHRRPLRCSIESLSGCGAAVRPARPHYLICVVPGARLGSVSLAAL